MKKLTLSLTVVLMMAIMVLMSAGVQAKDDQEKGKVEFNVKQFAELSVEGGNLDCDFGTVDPFASVNPTCNPDGSLVVKSNTNWRLDTVKSKAQPANLSDELINVLRVSNRTSGATLVGFGTSSGSITGSSSTTIPVQYELRTGSGPVGGGYLANLDARPGNSDYSVTVTYTLSTP